MSEMRRFGLIDLLLLISVTSAAAGLRGGYLMRFCDNGRSSGPLRVQDARPPVSPVESDEPIHGTTRPNEFDVLIDSVQNRRGFVSPAPFSDGEEATAHVAPGYPYLVGLLGQAVPAEKLDSTVRWIQVALGSLTAAFYFLFARRAFRSLLVATLAGFFAAAYPFWIFSTAALDDGVLATFALAGCLLMGSQSGEKGGALRSLLLGLALGGLPLVRAALLPFAFIGLMWFLLRSRTLPNSWLCGLLSFLGFMTALAPWTVRNYQVFNEPVSVATTTYLHLWIGNNPHATGGPATAEMLADAPADEMRKIPNQQARYAQLGKEVNEEVQANPVRTMKRRIHAALAFFLGDRWLADGTLADWTAGEEEEGSDWLERRHPGILQGTLLALLALAFLGWRWTFGWRWESAPATLAMIWVPLPYILGHAEGLSGPRLPLDGVLLCYAAFALVALVPGLGGALFDPEKRRAQLQKQQEEES